MLAPKKQAQIGIIGGSGFYSLLSDSSPIKVETPFGPPSDKVALGKIAGKKVAFLSRHGRTHDFPPHKINYRANIWALKSLGVERIITVTACGSLQRRIKPGDFVILDQFVDRTRGREDTFYDGPLSTHVSLAYPYCRQIAKIVYRQGRRLKLRIHPTGTMVVIQGPRFSTAAESEFFTKMGWEVVNMTSYPEVVLARELEICYGAIAICTDWDAGLVVQKRVKPVTANEIVKVFKNNVVLAKKLIKQIIKNLPDKRECVCSEALKGARL
jgi:5'-methylthioadenosine phosphorylase